MTDDRKSESGSAEVAPRMAVLRRHLHDAVPLDQAATDAGISLRTARRWLARYRADGPAGLARPTRPEAGKRTLPKELVELIEGMALLKPPPSIAICCWKSMSEPDFPRRSRICAPARPAATGSA